jgi:hypothetical protein
MNKLPTHTAKPLKTNVFEDDARARREKRFEREALIEQNRPITRYQNGMVSGGSLAARMQGFTHQNMPLGYVPEPVPDAVRPFIFVSNDSFVLRSLQNVIDWDKHTIVGKSSAIFKNYLRLTSVRLQSTYSLFTFPDNLDRIRILKIFVLFLSLNKR